MLVEASTDVYHTEQPVKHLSCSFELSVKTVEAHKFNLMRKLDLHNTAAVTLFAVRNGMLPVGEAQDAERRETNAG